MNNKLKNNYWKPTPVWARKLGDALLGASTFVTGYGIANNWNKEFVMIALITGAVGKFLTNLFAESNTEENSMVNDKGK